MPSSTLKGIHRPDGKGLDAMMSRPQARMLYDEG
jgi:hypothetical protein